MKDEIALAMPLKIDEIELQLTAINPAAAATKPVTIAGMPPSRLLKNSAAFANVA